MPANPQGPGFTGLASARGGHNLDVTSIPQYLAIRQPDGSFRHSLTVIGVPARPPVYVTDAVISPQRMTEGRATQPMVTVREDGADGFAVTATVISVHATLAGSTRAILEGTLAEAVALSALGTST